MKPTFLSILPSNHNKISASLIEIHTDMPHYQWDFLNWIDDNESSNSYRIDLCGESEDLQKRIINWFYEKSFNYTIIYHDEIRPLGGQ